MLTKQEVFDKVCERLNDGRGRAFLEGTGCVMRTPDGIPCAAGCIIPDDNPLLKNQDFIAAGITKWIYGGGDNCPPEFKAYRSFILALQNVHDVAHFWDGNKFKEWGELWSIAASDGLLFDNDKYKN